MLSITILVPVAGETYFTHATQDQDHGMPTSPRTTTMEGDIGRQQHYGTYLSSHDSESSYNTPSDASYTLPYSPHRSAPHPSRYDRVTRWVYEWQDPKFYEMLVSNWQETACWTGQSWHEYKAMLLQTRGIALISTEEYNMTAWARN